MRLRKGKTRQGKTQERKVRKVRIGKLLKRPLENAEELERLTAWVAERRERLGMRLRVTGALAVVLVIINLATSAFRSRVDDPGRVFSLIAILGLAVLWTPGMVRRLRTHPRLVCAQRQLLRQRGLLPDEGADAMGEEIERLAQRIRKRFVVLGIDDVLLVDAERRAYVLLEQLARNEEGSTTGYRERLHAEQVSLRSRLEAFRVALANMEVEALLQRPQTGRGGEVQCEFYAGDGARNALLAAAALLEGNGSGTPAAVARPFAGGSGAWQADSTATLTVPAVPRGLLGSGGAEPAEGDESGTAIPRPDFTSARASIAVLPFADLSPDQDQEYFCHGLAEELINALTRIRDLRVIARASSFSFLGERRDVREIGRALGVDTVVEGSVRKSGQRLRITVQLIRTVDGHHLWSERYDRDAGDVFAVQDEITAALVDHLHLELWGERPPGRRQKVDLDAYHLYLRARHHWNRRSPTELYKSAELFQEAIGKDPGYGVAHAGLADAFVLLGFYSVLPPNEAFPKAITAATQALEIDGDLSEAHTPLAFASLLYQWDWKAAERSFRRALRRNPGYATAHHWYSEYLGLMGRHDEALERAVIARELDPLSPVVHTLVGWVHYYARRYDSAIAALEKTLELENGFAPAEFWLGLAQAEKGDYQRAGETLGQAVEHSNRSTMMLAASGRLRAVVGDVDEAHAVLRELDEISRQRYVPPYYCAALHSACGEIDATFGCLGRAFEERDNWLVFLQVDPIWDSLRADGRFRELLEKVGFET